MLLKFKNTKTQLALGEPYRRIEKDFDGRVVASTDICLHRTEVVAKKKRNIFQII